MKGEIGRAKQLVRRLRSLAGPRSRAQLRELLRDSKVQGLLDADGLSMLEGVLEVSDLQVRQIMVPREQMTCVRRDDAAARILAVVLDSGHSRFPVLDADSEAVVGVLLAKDLLRVYAGAPVREFRIDELMRRPVFVPETKRVNLLLKELRLSRNHLAIVVDEYGAIAGLVTIEDVMEQIVGEIDDEFDVDDETNIRAEVDRQFSVRGATPIEEFNEFFSTRFPDDESDTIAGLVMRQFGRMPRRGESVTIDGFEFRIVRADRRRIDGLRVIVPLPVPPSDESAEAIGAGQDSG
jgi:magnesium and cobalt transporter